jgi:hypothetical protein
MNLILNFRSLKKKDNKYKKERKVTRIKKKDSEELLIKFKDIIDVLLKLAKDHTDLKDH